MLKSLLALEALGKLKLTGRPSLKQVSWDTTTTFTLKTVEATLLVKFRLAIIVSPSIMMFGKIKLAWKGLRDLNVI